MHCNGFLPIFMKIIQKQQYNDKYRSHLGGANSSICPILRAEWVSDAPKQ